MLGILAFGEVIFKDENISIRTRDGGCIPLLNFLWIVKSPQRPALWGKPMTTFNRTEVAVETWNGKNRRSRYDRRVDNDRRTLLRFETIGCDRRLGTPRRKEEMIWERAWPSHRGIH